MGIQDFNKYVLSIDKNVFQEIEIDNLRGKKFAIDISIYLYKYLCTAQQYETNWFDMISKFILKLKRLDIYLIVVFDGTPPKEKLETLNQRRENKKAKMVEADQLEALLESADLTCEIARVEKALKINNAGEYSHDELHKMCLVKYGKMNAQHVTITNEHLHALKSFLTFVGIPWFVATGEAERTCAWLAKHHYVAAVISDDTDVLCFGAPVMIKGFTNVNKTVTKIKLNTVKKALKLSTAQFVDFCILCGTDYNNRVPGIGPSKAHSLFGNNQTLDTITVKNEQVAEALDYPAIRKLFAVPESNDIAGVIDLDTEFNINVHPRSNYQDFKLILKKCKSELTIENVSNSIGFGNFVLNK